MVKLARGRFVCRSCGAAAARWAGKCGVCGDWNTLAEEAAPLAPLLGAGRAAARGEGGAAVALEPLSLAIAPPERMATGFAELDRVTGGGIVPGSALLIAGEP